MHTSVTEGACNQVKYLSMKRYTQYTVIISSLSHLGYFLANRSSYECQAAKPLFSHS